MGAAVGVQHVIGKGFDGLGVGISVLQRNFDLAVLDCLIDVENVVIDMASLPTLRCLT
jgi:hypothetical protein